MSESLNVAYVSGTFPQLTQTFVAREIYWIRRSGVSPHIFSLSRPKQVPISRESDELADVHYSRALSKAVFAAQWDAIRRRPRAYFGALFRCVVYSFREPKLLLQALLVFPKSVYFARQMSGLGVQHVHSHFLTLPSIAAAVAAHLLGVTHSVTAHAVGVFSRSPESLKRQLADVSRIVTISTYHRAFIREQLSVSSSEPIEIVHCGIDPADFVPVPKPEEKTLFSLLAVGRLVEKKGFEYLIDACARLRDLGLDFHCEIVGGGPREDALRRRIDQHNLQDWVRLMGPLDQDGVLGRFRATDVFVLPCVVAANGDRDGLPVVLMEAMSCGLPVVTTPVAGIVDLVVHDQTGILIGERDVTALVSAITLLRDDPDLRHRLGIAGRALVEEAFNVRDTSADLAGVFRDVALPR
jgi:glycosyltransferase involved in cell wall biosynthesis